MSDPLTSLGERAARNIAGATKTPPQMAMITPRWLLRLLPWVDVEAGTYHVDRVRVVDDELDRVNTRVVSDPAVLDAQQLRSLPLFRSLSDELINWLASQFSTAHFATRELIVNQGDNADRFFIVASGKVEVSVKGPAGNLVLRVLGPGNYFGEVGLIRPWGGRSATAQAMTPTVLLVLDRARFDAALAMAPTLRAALEASVEELTGEHRVDPPYLSSHGDIQDDLSSTFVDYDLDPCDYKLSTVQTVLRAQARVNDFYRSPMDQLKEQIWLALEACRERQEWEILNNPEFGLLHNAVPSMRIPARTGPPTPDDMDQLLSLVWKEPAFFLAHPKAIAAFGRECTRRGVVPRTVGMFGTQFPTWRGVPIVPSDKLSIDTVAGVPSTSILLMRIGAERQGVIGLHQPSIGDPELPSATIHFSGFDAKDVASYVLTLHFSAVVLTSDAIGVLENVEVGHFHDVSR